jgi:hypothetical protein
MRHFSYLLAFAMAGGLIAGPGFARTQPSAQLQALDDQLPGDLVNDPSSMAWQFSGKGMATKALRDPSIPGGGAGIEVRITSPGANPWDAQAQIPLLAGIEAGQDVTVGFYARAQSASGSGKGEITVRVQQNVSPFAGFVDKTLAIGKNWAFHEVSGKASRAIAANQAVVALQFAGARQELELGQMIVVVNATKIVSDTPQPPAGGQAVALPASLQGKGRLLLDPGKRDAWAFYGPGMTRAAGTSRVMGVTSIRASVAAAAPHPYDTAITVPIDEAIAKGDAIIVAVVARTNAAESPDGNGHMIARVMANEAPWPGFGDKDLAFEPGQWQLVGLRAVASLDIPAGKGAAQLQLGGAKQDFDIGPVFVIKETGAAPQ